MGAVKAPWPKGFVAKWWVHEVMRERKFEGHTDYDNLIDIRRFFWITCSIRVAVILVVVLRCCCCAQVLQRRGVGVPLDM